jgi:hypothetical protein
MLRRRYRFVLHYGTAAALFDVARRVRTLEEERGWVISRLWNPSFGTLNEFFFDADYPDEESFRLESDARTADENHGALWQEIYPNVVPGSFWIDLLDEIDLRMISG